jgi:hypothetical protein
MEGASSIVTQEAQNVGSPGIPFRMERRGSELKGKTRPGKEVQRGKLFLNGVQTSTKGRLKCEELRWFGRLEP